MNRVIFGLLIFVAACTSSNTTQNTSLNVIDVAGSLNSDRVVNISEIADTVEYIPLETMDESLVGKLQKNNIFFERGLFYLILESGEIALFNYNGLYIRRFDKLGRGPGEYTQIADLDVDYVTGNIFIENMSTINEYSIVGDFLGSIQFPYKEEFEGMIFLYFKKLSDYYVVTSRMYKNFSYSGMVIDSASNLAMMLEYPKEEIDLITSFPRGMPSYVVPKLFKYKDKVRIIKGCNKYILSINNDLTIDTAFVINYGKLSPHSQPGKLLRAESPFLWRSFDVFESDNYLFMTFHVGSLVKKPSLLKNAYDNDYVYPHSPSLFNKVTGELTLLSQPEDYKLGFKEDLHDGPPIWPIYVSSDNYLVSIISAMELKHYVSTNEVSRELASIAASLKEESNPVIVRVKLKTQPS